jgi:3'5'-cyclic nucleotide phosphodiesterase
LLLDAHFSVPIDYGISNATLVKEKNPIAIFYGGKSPAENHSLSLGWELLMEPDYSDLVDCICGKDRKDADRLKDLLTNAVLATDVFDKELKEGRDTRWNRVFGTDDLTRDEAQHLDSLKATIVMEHLIQASDVAHTMQHWHVYIKWVSGFSALFAWNCCYYVQSLILSLLLPGT